MFRCVVLAGGKGTRLKSVVNDIPKPLAPVCGVPFLSLLLNKLNSVGMRDVIISTGHLAHKITDNFGPSFKNLNILYAHEEEALGTGGAILNAVETYGLSEPFFLVNGDTFFDINYVKLEEEWRRQNCDILMAVRKLKNADRYGIVDGKDGIVLSFLANSTARGKLSNSGSYLISPSIFRKNHLPKKFSFEADFIPKHLDKEVVRYLEFEGYFIDIGIPDDYTRAQLDFQNSEFL